MKSKNTPEFIVYAPAFLDTVGGVIALHLLCDRLNRNGSKAALWPWGKPAQFSLTDLKSIRSRFGYYLKSRVRNYARGPFSSPIASARYIRDAVVIYPEIVSGNPLGATKVARWFLHKPGHHTGHINYGHGEIYFFYDHAFNDRAINPDDDNLLRLTYVNPVYSQTNFGPRDGSCYLVRKGKHRLLNQHPADAVPIDNLSHDEKAALFNQVECLYSYDPYTFYAHYAAMCGCIPIIIPESGVTKEEWQPSPNRRLGIAYGADEIFTAKQERGRLLDVLKEDAEEENQMLRRFIHKCRVHFST